MKLTRRRFSAAAGAAVMTAGLRRSAASAGVPALFFDVFGTLVDWRSSIARQAQASLEPLGHKIDWLRFADAWAGEYQPSLEEVRSGRRPFVKLDVLNLESLVRVLHSFGVEGLSGEAVQELNLAWHKLDAWPDVPGGLRRLRAKYRLATVSNGNVSMMQDVAAHNGIAFDAYLGAELAQNYKPAPNVYTASAKALGLEPSACTMVASHSYDLEAAAKLGLRTAHVARPNEAGPGRGESAPSVKVDSAARDLGELATMLGA
jgi:2-haloacid dehalogenase